MTFDSVWVHIDNELLKMQKALYENQRFLAAVENYQQDSVLYDGLIGSLAMNLQSFYTGAERICLKIARDIDDSVARGERWHKTLLEQMAIETDQRPVVLESDTFTQLEQLRGFRHFVRNAYSYTLEAERVLLLAETLTTCYESLERNYLIFKQLLQKQV
ncbi:MAG: hypothetical protein KTR27_07465 [Leptolyngbyaceae cyanobacterium MAG.088]|nr:hypothetical protein [Leptolyngbyaceae cyanobacterium MAG.088]